MQPTKGKPKRCGNGLMHTHLALFFLVNPWSISLLVSYVTCIYICIDWSCYYRYLQLLWKRAYCSQGWRIVACWWWATNHLCWTRRKFNCHHIRYIIIPGNNETWFTWCCCLFLVPADNQGWSIKGIVFDNVNIVVDPHTNEDESSVLGNLFLNGGRGSVISNYGQNLYIGKLPILFHYDLDWIFFPHSLTYSVI